MERYCIDGRGRVAGLISKNERPGAPLLHNMYFVAYLSPRAGGDATAYGSGHEAIPIGSFATLKQAIAALEYFTGATEQ